MRVFLALAIILLVVAVIVSADEHHNNRDRKHGHRHSKYDHRDSRSSDRKSSQEKDHKHDHESKKNRESSKKNRENSKNEWEGKTSDRETNNNYIGVKKDDRESKKIDRAHREALFRLLSSSNHGGKKSAGGKLSFVDRSARSRSESRAAIERSRLPAPLKEIMLRNRKLPENSES